MVCAFISDVHSNLEALKSVFKDLKKRKISNILFLGDAVGYGSHPNECTEILKSECRVLIAGNHDWGVAGRTDTDFFNENAKTAIKWTKSVISMKNIEALRSLPVKSVLKNENITLVHSTPCEPEKWHYLISISDAEINFQYFDTSICYIGHSHRPFIVEKRLSGESVKYKNKVILKKNSRYIINVGSVGQPRDGDPRASYAVSDGEKIEIARVYYDVEATQREIIKAGLPVQLAERLSLGM